MLNTPLISDLIFKGEVAEIKEIMKRSRELGMQTFDQSLFDLYEAQTVTFEDALRNADSVKAKMVLEGANSPTTPKADQILADNDVHVVPDVMANAGGVVVSYFEWVQNLQHFRWDEREVNDKLGTIMRRAYREVAARGREEGTTLRIAAYETGIERVLEAAAELTKVGAGVHAYVIGRRGHRRSDTRTAGRASTEPSSSRSARWSHRNPSP